MESSLLKKYKNSISKCTLRITSWKMHLSPSKFSRDLHPCSILKLGVLYLKKWLWRHGFLSTNYLGIMNRPKCFLKQRFSWKFQFVVEYLQSEQNWAFYAFMTSNHMHFQSSLMLSNSRKCCTWRISFHTCDLNASASPWNEILFLFKLDSCMVEKSRKITDEEEWAHFGS